MTDWRTEARESGRIRILDEDEEVEKQKRKRLKKIHGCKALECLLCHSRFSKRDIISGVYNIETFVCSFCYSKMQSMPHSKCCFGKPTTILLNKKKLLGYNPKAETCKSVCPDRVICQRIVRPDLVNLVELEL